MALMRNFMVVGVTVLTTSMAYAQTSVQATGTATSEAVSASASGSASDKKATRAQNHLFSRAVQHAIDASRDIGDADILVFGNAADGKVVLVGYVFDQKQEQAAVDAAHQVAGVTEVTSRLMMQLHDE
jgi:hyperosmotically inducible periplasmic protein